MSEEQNGFNWRSQPAFVVVAAGATLSLNEFLTFPVLAGENGGGAFLLFYILFLFVLGLPLLMAELMLGRLTRTDPSAALRLLSDQHGASIYWKLVGLSTMLAAFFIIATLSVVAGWSLAYAVQSAAGAFVQADMELGRQMFHDFTTDSERMALWHTLFVILLVSICAQPLKIGLERATLVLLPIMVVLLIILLILAFTSSGMGGSIRSFLYVDFSVVDSNTPILALQRAFYTLALGIGVMMAYGRYLPSGISIGYSAAMIITVDLVFSIIVGLSINALMISAGQLPAIDGHFIFDTIPIIMNQFVSGRWFGALFFLLMTIAALTTSVALLEAPIMYLRRKCQISRLQATLFIATGIWLLGLGVILAQGVWNGNGFTIALFFGDEAVRLVNNADFNDVLVFVSSHLIQPFAALLICLFVAWVIPRELSYKELNLSRMYWFEIWNYLIRYIAPVLLIIVLLASLGII